MRRPLVVIVLVDALGWEVARRHAFAPAVLPGRSRLGTVLGYSSAAIPSLVTGRPPAEHGLWSMYRRARAGDDVFAALGVLRRLPPLPHALEWRLRRLVRRALDRSGRVGGYYDLYEIPLRELPRFTLAAPSDPYVPGGVPGSETLFDRMHAEGVRWRAWTWRTEEARNVRELMDALGGDDDVLFLYTAELDAMMHRLGVEAEPVGRRLRVWEDRLERIVTQAHRAGRDPRVVLLSDHGMTPVHRTVDVAALVAARGVRRRRDDAWFLDSTMVRLWGRPAFAEAVGEALREADAGDLLDDATLERWGCRFPDGAYGESVVLARPGILIVPSYMGSTPVAAMHGYDPDDVHSPGVFMTNVDASPPPSILDVRDWLLERIREARS